MSVRVAVFASGSGSNLQALLDRFTHDSAAQIVLVISDVADAGALARARQAGVRAVHVPVRGRAPDDVAGDMLALLDAERIALIALAGYLRLVPPAVVARFRSAMLNVHPALLPAFGGPGMYGRRVHEAVLAAGCTISGVTVHYVDERYDEGRIIAQWPVPVLPDDTPERLAARVLAVEHLLYPAVLAAVARTLAGPAPARGLAAERSFTAADSLPAERGFAEGRLTGLPESGLPEGGLPEGGFPATGGFTGTVPAFRLASPDDIADDFALIMRP